MAFQSSSSNRCLKEHAESLSDACVAQHPCLEVGTSDSVPCTLPDYNSAPSPPVPFMERGVEDILSQLRHEPPFSDHSESPLTPKYFFPRFHRHQSRHQFKELLHQAKKKERAAEHKKRFLEKQLRKERLAIEKERQEMEEERNALQQELEKHRGSEAKFKEVHGSAVETTSASLSIVLIVSMIVPLLIGLW